MTSHGQCPRGGGACEKSYIRAWTPPPLSKILDPPLLSGVFLVTVVFLVVVFGLSPGILILQPCPVDLPVVHVFPASTVASGASLVTNQCHVKL